jgi:hypothetical protein
VNGSVREAVTALLEVQTDLYRLLSRCPEAPEERGVWTAGVTSALIEAARGRVYLRDLVAAAESSETLSVA